MTKEEGADTSENIETISGAVEKRTKATMLLCVDVWLHIVKYLEPKDVCHLGQSSPQLSQLVGELQWYWYTLLKQTTGYTKAFEDIDHRRLCLTSLWLPHRQSWQAKDELAYVMLKLRRKNYNFMRAALPDRATEKRHSELFKREVNLLMSHLTSSTWIAYGAKDVVSSLDSNYYKTVFNRSLQQSREPEHIQATLERIVEQVLPGGGVHVANIMKIKGYVL